MDMMSLDELEKAFGVFNDASSGLESAYASLENRVRELADALRTERAERLQRERERNRIARRLDRLIDVLPGAVMVLDRAGRVSQCNASALRIFGRELEGARWSEISEACLEPVGRGTEFIAPGGRRLALATQSLTPDPGQVLLFTDVTESRAIDALSEQHGRLSAMGEMAASLAHQIRTPLASALLYASSAASPEAGTGQKAEMMTKLVCRLHDLERLVNDMLLFASGSGPVDAGIAVAEILHSALATVAPKLHGTQRVEIDAAEPELMVTGSEQALAGAVINLVNNALEAAGDDAWVTLMAGRSETGAVEIRVMDNGPGIEPGTEETIFEPFHSGRPGGTGLGLAVVRSVAREHGGDAWAVRGHREGACFVLSLPPASRRGTRHAEVAA